MKMTKSGTALVVSDVVIVPFPYTDLTGQKERPALLLSAPDVLGDVLVLPITSKSGWPGALELRTENLLSGALAKNSWIRCDKIVTLNRTAVVRIIGRLKSEHMILVHKQVCTLLGCKS